MTLLTTAEHPDPPLNTSAAGGFMSLSEEETSECRNVFLRRSDDRFPREVEDIWYSLKYPEDLMIDNDVGNAERVRPSYIARGPLIPALRSSSLHE